AGPDHPYGFPTPVREDASLIQEDPDAAVRPNDPVLEAEGVFLADGGGYHGAGVLAIVGMDPLEKSFIGSAEGGRVEPVDRAELIRPPDDVPVDVPFPTPHPRGPLSFAKTRLALL